MGLPVHDLAPQKRIDVARFIEAAVGSFSFEELSKIADQSPMDDLRGALAVAEAVLDVLPDEMKTLMPPGVAEVMPALLAPVLIQLRQIVEQMAGEQQLTAQREASEVSQGAATMDPMPLPSRSQEHTHQAKSA